MFGEYSGPSPGDLIRHSVTSANYYDSLWQQHQMELFQPFHSLIAHRRGSPGLSSAASDLFSFNIGSRAAKNMPPLLPPKRSQVCIDSIMIQSNFLQTFISLKERCVITLLAERKCALFQFVSYWKKPEKYID